jgi:hypothetical protein
MIVWLRHHKELRLNTEMQVATQVDYLDSCKIELEFQPNHTVRDYTAAVREKKVFSLTISSCVFVHRLEKRVQGMVTSQLVAYHHSN